MRATPWLVIYLSIICVPSFAQPAFRWGVEFDLTLGFVRTNTVNWAFDSEGEVVIAAASGDRIALFNLDGEMLPGWPTTETEDWWIEVGPRLGDVTGDGEIDVIVMMRNYMANDAQLRVYDFVGTIQSEFTASWFGFQPSNRGEVILADLDGDSIANVVCAIDSVYAVDQQGNQLSGFPFKLAGSIGQEGIVVIPDELYSGKAIVSTTMDSINVVSLSTFTFLPGWPRSFPFTAALQTQPVVVPFEGTWAIAMFAEDSLFAWNDHGEDLPGFPMMLGLPTEQCRDFSVTDIDQDGSPEFSLQKASAQVSIVSLQGDMLPGFPWNEDRMYKGYGEDVLSLHVDGEDSVRLFFPADLRVGDTNQYQHGMMSLEGSTESEEFPIYNDRTEANYFPSSAIIWTGQSDTLHIIHLAPYGYLSRFDLPLPGASVKLIWPVPGGNPGGNRVYNPGPYVGVAEKEGSGHSMLPVTPAIRNVYPNPGNGAVRIEYSLPLSGRGELQISNALGQVVWTAAVTPPGGNILWPGIDSAGVPIASGHYYAQLTGSSAAAVAITIVR